MKRNFLSVEYQAFTTVRTTQTPIEAALVISILESAGLHPLELSTAGHCTVAGADIDYSVRVPTAEAAEAREILSSYDNRPPNSYQALHAITQPHPANEPAPYEKF